MLTSFTFLVIGVAVAMITVNAQILKPAMPPPNGTYICYNNTVTVSFDQNQTNGISYQQVFINPHANVTGCSTKEVNAMGQFVLYVTDLVKCGIVPDMMTGMATFQVRIQHLIMYVTQHDTLTNITCNVTADGPTQKLMSNYTITGDIIVVDGTPGNLPIAALMAMNIPGGGPVNQIVLGVRFWLCLQFNFTYSLFKGAIVDDVYTTDPDGNKLYLIKDGCKSKDIPQADPSYPTTNITTWTIYIELNSFRFFKDHYVVFRVIVIYSKHHKIQVDGNTCKTKGKRSADDDDTVSREYTVTLPVSSSNDGKVITREEVRVVDKTQNNKNAICEGHISATIFYAVVAVLAFLFVFMIGVAVMFAARARSVIVSREGKDNKAF